MQKSIIDRLVGRSRHAAALGLLVFGLLGAAKPDGFYLDRLPRGKNVTIPRPATTLIPLASRVQLTSTDMPQSVSFRPINTAGGSPAAIRLALYDRYSDRVKYIELKPGTPFLYSYKTISSITVIPEVVSGGKAESLMLQVESDKPLEIAH